MANSKVNIDWNNNLDLWNYEKNNNISSPSQPQVNWDNNLSNWTTQNQPKPLNILPPVSSNNSNNNSSNGYFSDVQNFKTQLNLPTLFKSNAPTWEKALLSPLAAFGTVGHYLSGDLDTGNGTLTGNKVTGQILDSARYAVTGGAYQPEQNLSTGNKAVDWISNAVGSGLGMVSNPEAYGGLSKIGDVAENATSKIIPNTNLLGKLGNSAFRGAAEMGTLGGIQSSLQDQTLQDTAKNIGENALMGAAFGSGSKALGEGFNFLKNNAIKTNVTESKINPLNPNGVLSHVNATIQPTANEIALGKVNIPLQNETPTEPLKTQYARIETPGQISMNLGLNNTEIGKPDYANIDSNNILFKESKFKSNTMRNAEILKGEDVQKVIDNVQSMYEVKPNEQSVNRAYSDLQNDPQSVIDRIKNSESLNSAEDSAAAGIITNQLRQEAQNTGDYTKLKDWLETVQPKVTSTAQSLQAISTWKKLTPEGALMKAQQVVGQVNRSGEKSFGKNFKNVELTPEDMKYIDDTMTKVQDMPDGRAKDIEFAKVKAFIADKIPQTLSNKISALQRIQLLLNPKTMVRNVLGNVIMGGLENIKDVPASSLDKLTSLKTGERTTLFPSLNSLSTQGKGLLKGTKETFQDAKLGVNTNPSSGQFELPQTQAFKKGVLSKIEKTTNTGLELGDRPFYQAAYDETLRQQMKMNKVDTPTQEMMDKAKAVAEDRTFQNVSTMVEGFKKLQTGLNSIGSGFGVGSKEFGLGNIALPFTKTPANILDKAIDYSPVGTIKAISQLMSKKTFDQKLFVDRIGRSLTGSAIIMLGYELSKNDLLTGSANKDKDVAALEKQTGKSPYAFKIGDTYRTFDWAQPAAIPLAIGADIFQQGKNQKQTTNIIMDAIKSGGTTLFQQSLLQGMQKLFGGTDPVSGIASTLSGIPTQFIPGSLSTALTKLKDPYVRDTYDPSKLKTIENQIQSKIPFLSENLPQKIDTMGRPSLQYQGNNNAFNVLVNPGTTTKYNPTDSEKLALDIYNKTGEKSQFPRVADNKITYTDKLGKSQTIQLTPKEKQDLQTYIGQQTDLVYSRFANDNSFNSLSDEDKTKLLQKRLTEIYNLGKTKILEGRGTVDYKR
jgi:hypothetical protein